MKHTKTSLLWFHSKYILPVLLPPLLVSTIQFVRQRPSCVRKKELRYYKIPSVPILPHSATDTFFNSLRQSGITVLPEKKKNT